MSVSTKRRPTIRRVRDWAPGATLPPPRAPAATLDDARDELRTLIARADADDPPTMVKTESGIRDLLFMPLTPAVSQTGNNETMEIVDVEVVPQKSDIRELAARAAAPSSVNALASLVDAYEARAAKAAASPSTEEIDADAIEEVKAEVKEEVKVAKRSAPPPLPRPRRALTPIVIAHARSWAWQSVHLAQRWPEVWDLDTRTKVVVLAMWMAFWVNLTLLFR